MRAPRLDDLTRDFVYAWRSLRRTPGLVAVSVLSFALGIGLNTTLFTTLNAFFFYEASATEPNRLVWVEPGNSNQWSYLNFRDLRDAGVFETVAGYRITQLAVRSGDDVERAIGLAVTSDFFDALGVRAQLGRTFDRGDAEAEREARMVVVSHAFWQTRFHADTGIVGQVLNLNGQAFIVIGVLPEMYRPVTRLFSPVAYVPLSGLVYPNLQDRSNGNALGVAGRLRAGVSREQVRAAVNAVDAQLERAYPELNEGMARPARVTAFAGPESLGASAAEAFVVPGVLLGLFGLVLLIACANVAGLLLARGAARRREVVLRSVLGASRTRIVQGLLAESVLLAIAGGGAAVLATVWSLPFFRTFAVPGVGSLALNLEPDLWMYAFAFALALAAGLASGIVPALKAARTDLAAELQLAGGHGTTGRLRLRHAFVVGQVTASVVLLVVASLFLRSLARASRLDTGFDRDSQLVARIDLDAAHRSAGSRALFAQELLDRIGAMPLVRSASVADIIPLGTDASSAGVEVEGRGDTSRIRSYLNSVGPRYFETMGIEMRRGREFGATDRFGGPPVAIVSQAFADRAFPGGEALGKRIRLGRGPYVEIVGVASDSTYRSLGERPQPLLYFAYAQRPVSSQLRPLTIHVHTSDVSAAMVRSLRQAIADVDPDAVTDISTLRQATGSEAALRRLGSTLLSVVAGLGLMLATVGLYGVISFVVASRTSEIGVRMALGASAGRVQRDVLMHGLRLVAIGIALGSVAALVLAQPLSAFLAGLSPADPIAFGLTAVVLAIVGLLASYLPARRATRVDPLDALRKL